MQRDAAVSNAPSYQTSFAPVNDDACNTTNPFHLLDFGADDHFEFDPFKGNCTKNAENYTKSTALRFDDNFTDDGQYNLFSSTNPFISNGKPTRSSEAHAVNVHDENAQVSDSAYSSHNTFSSVFSDLPSFFESTHEKAKKPDAVCVKNSQTTNVDDTSSLLLQFSDDANSLFSEAYVLSDSSTKRVSPVQSALLSVPNTSLKGSEKLTISSTSINLLHSPSSYEIAKQKNKLLSFEDSLTAADDILDIKEKTGPPTLFATSSVSQAPIASFEAIPLDIPPFYESDYSEIGGWLLQVRKPMQQQQLTGINFCRSALQRLSDSTNKRNWMEAFVKLSFDDHPRLQLFYVHDKLSPFFELPLLPSYSVSDIYLQNFDSNMKIHTCKIIDESAFHSPVQSLFPSNFMRRFSRISTNSVKLEVIKFGHFDYDYLRKFTIYLDNAFWKNMIHTRVTPVEECHHEEIEFKARDELVCIICLDSSKSVYKSRTRVFVKATLNGCSVIIEMSINDKSRCGNEVVARRDIVPVRNEVWITPEQVELSRIVDEDEYKLSRVIKFIPPHNYRFELMRYRTYVPPNFELPLNVRCNVVTFDMKVEVKVEVFAINCLDPERTDGSVPCESIRIKIPLPDKWAQMLQIEKRFRCGSVMRNRGKFTRAGLEKLLTRSNSMSMDSSACAQACVYKTTGRIKYERILRALVWKINQLPKRNEAPYKIHTLFCRFILNTSTDMSESFQNFATVDFRMKTCVSSQTQIRSISTPLNSESVLKICKLRSKVSYEVEIEYSKSSDDFTIARSTSIGSVLTTGESSEVNDSEASASSNKSDDLMYSD